MVLARVDGFVWDQESGPSAAAQAAVPPAPRRWQNTKPPTGPRNSDRMVALIEQSPDRPVMALADALRGREALRQPVPDRRRLRVAVGAQDVDEVPAGDQNDGVLVCPDLFVCLTVDVAGGDEHAEHAVADAGDEPGGLFDADGVAQLIALCL